MKKIFTLSCVVVAILLMSGCGDSVKSVEEYSKLEKTELDKMFEECKSKLETKVNLFGGKNDPKDLERLKEIEEINVVIMKSRGSTGDNPGMSYFGFIGYGLVSDDELKEFGNSRYAEFVKCGRIEIAKKGGMEALNKPRKSYSERFKNIGK